MAEGRGEEGRESFSFVTESHLHKHLQPPKPAHPHGGQSLPSHSKHTAKFDKGSIERVGWVSPSLGDRRHPLGTMVSVNSLLGLEAQGTAEVQPSFIALGFCDPETVP